MPNPRAIAACLALIVTGLVSPLFASPGCNPWAARLVSLEGRVELRRDEGQRWRPVSIGEVFCFGDQLRVGPSSRASVELNNDTVLRLDQNSTLIFPEAERTELTFIDLIRGALHLISRIKGELEIRTPFVNAGLEGTEFVVRVLETETLVSVIEGEVTVSNPFGSLRLSGGQVASGTKTSAPVLRLDVKPEDAVQWAIHYPAIAEPGAVGLAADILDAQELLRVGRVDEALRAIEAVVDRDPENSDALALASIIELAQNRKAEALTLARRAVESDATGAALTALSYVQQAGFELDAARETVEAATQRFPEQALLWSRLAELQMAIGDRREALGSARRSVDLNPDLSRTQTVLGFAHLAGSQAGDAQGTFEQAIRLDSSDPLPRLGLGLAKIRQGELADGRREMEIAVSLDPANSLLRSYLGKAYFEENRGAEAGTEFELARQLDPLDPTPWLYDAVRKQAANRPVEAAEDLQRSIVLNDKRAVYRSGLMLDQDSATRSVSLANLFRDIGIEQRAVALGTRSLAVDPSNSSAHRLLADAYVGTPRRGIAQVSELLQAQLLQPLNSRPVAPQSLIRELDRNSGLASFGTGSSEFTELFDREGPRFGVGLLAGNHDTGGGELLLSGLSSRFAYSAGYFKYDTDGFRKGADVTQETYNGFFQASVSDALDLQLELRHRDTQQGDLRLRPDPSFIPNEERTLDQDTYRFGAHLRPSVHDHLIASFIWTERKATLRERDAFRTQEVDETREGYSAEVQYIHRWPSANLISGGGLYRIDVDQFGQVTIPGFPFPIPPDSDNFNVEAENFYVYSNVEGPGNTAWTLGLSRENYSDDGLDFDVSKWNPKIGMQWQATEALRLRAAYLKTLKRQLTVDQTLEPTQVAGFNQFFDDFNGTRAELYGIAFDFDVSRDILTSIELTTRDAKELDDNEKLDEDIIRGQVSWIANRYWTGSLGFFSEDSKIRGPTGRLDVSTQIVPLTVNFHHPRGFFGQVTGTYVEQEVQLGSAPETDEDFGLLDVAIGYRLPNDRGRLALEISNAFDEEFRYLDDRYKTSDPFNVYRPFFPTRSIRFIIGLKF